MKKILDITIREILMFLGAVLGGAFTLFLIWILLALGAVV